MLHEYHALQRNNTWTLVPLPSDANVVGCEWVLKKKRKSDGSLDRHKARLIAKGYHQSPGIDYIDTFSPVVKPITIHLIITIALTQNWLIHQLDVNSAILHGNLLDLVFMTQPSDFINPHHLTYVCRLQKALYGLKQAPWA